MKTALFASLSLFLLLPSCGNSGVAGTWVLDTSVMKKKMQESMNRAQAKNPKQNAMAKMFMKQMLASLDKMKVQMVLHGDGTFTVTSSTPKSKAPQEGKGTWKLEKDILTLTPKSGNAFGAKLEPKKFRYDGSTLVPEDDSKAKEAGMVFRKQ